MTKAILAGIAVAGLSSAAAGSLVVIDFADLEFPDSQTHDVGETYSSQGFVFSKGPNEPFAFAVFGQFEPRYPGQASLFNNTVDGLIRLTQQARSIFDMVSIDFAPLNSATPVMVHFTGYLDDAIVAQQSFQHSGSAIQLETFFFNDDFKGIDRLEWFQNSPFHQFSNVTIIPAPTSLALLGLSGLLARRRR